MARPTRDQKWREAISKKVTKLTPEVVAKLKQAFAIGATVEQACYYAEIHKATYYRWIEKNPVLSDEFDHMRQRLPLKAKQNIANAIETGNSIADSWRLLERTESDQYGEKMQLKHSGEIGDGTPPEDRAAIEALHATLKENMRKRSRERAKAEGEITT